MLIPLRSGELDRLVPAVATGNQFRQALGNPRKILQRIMISSIGGVITLLISQSQVASRFYSFWLIIGVTFLLYLLWGPIVEAGQKNSVLRREPYAALFDGQVAEIGAIYLSKQYGLGVSPALLDQTLLLYLVAYPSLVSFLILLQVRLHLPLWRLAL